MDKPLGKPALKLVADRFKLLASPTRLELLQHVCSGERSVSELVSLTGFKQANVSRNLSMLDRAGLVRRRVDGSHVYYSLAEPTLPSLCELMQASLRNSQDRARSCL